MGQSLLLGQRQATRLEQLSPNTLDKLKALDRYTVLNIGTAPAKDRVTGHLEGRLGIDCPQWLDSITNQGDRHHNIYFIRIDLTTREAPLEGIDNGASFPDRHIEILGRNNRKVEVQYDTAHPYIQRPLVATCPSCYKRDALNILFDNPQKA